MTEIFHIHQPTIAEIFSAEYRRRRGRDAWIVAHAFGRGIPYRRVWGRTLAHPDWRLVAQMVRRTQQLSAHEAWARLKAWREEFEMQPFGSLGQFGTLLGMPIVVEGWDERFRP